MQINKLTAHQLKDLIRKKEISAEEALTAVYDQIEETEKDIGAYVSLTKEKAFLQAKAVDKKIKNGERVGNLAGIPMAIKDNMCIKDGKTTCSSKILENFVAPYNATVIEKLQAADAVFIGKTNMDEFAMGSSTENSSVKTTKNPCDLTRVPGGSSGGSAAAVAGKEAILAIGSDTGGSIRQPAACCGVVGMKPTYGRVSRYGLVAFASSLDQIGPLTKDVTDSALLLNEISGYDEKDSTSINVSVPDYTRCLTKGVKGLKIGIPREYFIEGMNVEVKSAVEKAIKILEGLGAKTQEVSLPHTEYAVAVYYLIATAEASANLARYDGVKYGYRTDSDGDLLDMYKKTRGEGFGSEVKRRIMLGTYVLSSGYYDAYYLKAQKVRTKIAEDFKNAFNQVDVIITPTAPTTAFKIGEKMADPLQMYLSDIFTISVNLAGIPAISIPCGLTGEGLPIGLQILAPPLQEERILTTAYSYEQKE
ncbi:Asp-tRNA(Asn)/Glu-tRNA(Gln) amidotransferase subunit GatA [bacterium]|nr:Asp-tRNA(Asn)/Glu-tRNA(Gln) amidotransferase subunit GatA [bacterium]